MEFALEEKNNQGLLPLAPLLSCLNTLKDFFLFKSLLHLP